MYVRAYLYICIFLNRLEARGPEKIRETPVGARVRVVRGPPSDQRLDGNPEGKTRLAWIGWQADIFILHSHT